MKLPSMCYRRLRGDLVKVFKTPTISTLETRTNTRGHSYKLKKQRCNTTLRQHFFIQRIVDRWNSLPAEVAEAPSLNASRTE